MFAALYEGGDMATAARARRLATGALRPDSVMARCTEASLAAQYDLVARRDRATATSLARMISRRLTSAPDTIVNECSLSAMTLRAQLAMDGDGATLLDVTQRLDSALRAAPAAPLLTILTGNLIATRAFVQLGDTARALDAVRRRPILYGPLLGWAALLHDEARLAAAMGERPQAMHAYRLFIALRDSADAQLQPEVLQARAGLTRLTKELRE
jgi:hypothetical protein